MPKRKEPELTQAEQSKRFKEAARKAGVTQDEDAFETAFKAVASHDHQGQKDQRPKK